MPVDPMPCQPACKGVDGVGPVASSARFVQTMLVWNQREARGQLYAARELKHQLPTCPRRATAGLAGAIENGGAQWTIFCITPVQGQPLCNQRLDSRAASCSYFRSGHPPVQAAWGSLMGMWEWPRHESDEEGGALQGPDGNGHQDLRAGACTARPGRGCHCSTMLGAWRVHQAGAPFGGDPCSQGTLIGTMERACT